ncbi:MAG: hypothetical protein LV477_06920 [Candidatus Nitrosotalea sp.]|nr:hypothetical protein [Candidatus Nitrosotalea sp.]
MKTLHLIVITTVSIGFALVWHFANFYDFEPSTTDDPFGINATVSYVHNLKISCIRQPCGPLNAFGLSYTSQKPVQLISYNICGGIYCIKQGNFASYGRGGTPDSPVWGGGTTLGEIPWKVGDIVDIRLKVQPVTIKENGDIVPEPEKTMFIDLGQSKITERID